MQTKWKVILSPRLVGSDRASAPTIEEHTFARRFEAERALTNIVRRERARGDAPKVVQIYRHPGYRLANGSRDLFDLVVSKRVL